MLFKDIILLILVVGLLFIGGISCTKKEHRKMDGPETEVVEKSVDADDAESEENAESGRPIEVINATTLPKEIKKPQSYLEYPHKAAHRGFKGDVILRILVDEKGVPQEVIIVKSPENKYKKEFEKAAIKAVMKGRWTPAYVDGKPVPVWMQYVVRFNP